MSSRSIPSMLSEEQRTIVKFVLAGVLRTALGVGMYLVLLYWLGLQPSVALAGEYALVFVTGYVLNRSWTFSNQGPAKATLLKYAIAFLLAYVLELSVLELAIHLSMGPEWGRMPSLVLATVASYLLQRYWVFRGR